MQLPCVFKKQESQGRRVRFEADMCDITRSDNDIGRFEQYRNIMDPTWPDKIN